MNFLSIPIEIVKNVGATMPFLRHFKEKHYSRKRKNFSEDIERFFDIYEKLCERYKNDLFFENKTLLELGPGNSLEMALLFLASGAKKVFLADKFKHFF